MSKMFNVFFSFCALLIAAQTAHSQARPVEYNASFEESDLDTKPYLRDFEYIVVINKATYGSEKQTVRVYRNGHRVNLQDVDTFIRAYGSKDSKKRLNELASKTVGNDTFLVSTGRDQFEPKGMNHAQRDSWTVTPAGYFMPQYFAVKHRSESYSKKGCGGLFGKIAGAVLGREMCTIMENAVFFNGAIAIHKAIPGTEGMLGEKASGGCVRLPGALAEYLFLNLKAAIDSRGVPRVNVAGEVAMDANGLSIMKTVHESIWGSLQARSALIIVQNKIVQ